jgi:acyl dehydratase
MRTFTSLEEIAAAEGELLGVSDWLTVDQDRIDKFADATGDHQWIHVDPARAAAGPFGRTIAHGYLTLSLLPVLTTKIVLFDTGGPRINYGLEKVRFPSPVYVDSRICLELTLLSVTEVSGGLQTVSLNVIRVEGQDRPACTAETVARVLRAA